MSSRRRHCRALAAFGGLLIVVSASTAAAEEDERHLVTATAGTAFLLMLGPLSGSGGASLEANVEGTLTRHYACAAGARVELGSGAPEAFVRFSSTAKLGSWLPAAGLELGATGWSDERSGGALLAEARASARRDLAPVYVAVHAAPLRFRAFDSFALSFLELQVGTHVSPFGRYLRLQLGLFALGVTL
jgi:hypothetical protein